MMKARALVHYHIFKNAGTSIDSSLKRSFGDRWAAFEGSNAHDIHSASQLATFMTSNPGFLAISSHLARPPLPYPDCLPVVFLRHPLLRAYSVYLFKRKDPGQPFADAAAEQGFADYIEWALREEPGSIVIRNYQVVHLSDASWRCDHILDARATEADLRQATALLNAWGVAGVVERFEESVDTYQALYGAPLPGLRLAYDRENVSEPEAALHPDRLAWLAGLLGEELHARFMAANALDLALHAHAGKVLDAAIARLSHAGHGSPMA